MQVYKGILLMGGVGFDSNIYLVDGELVVDTGTGMFFSEIRDEMEKYGFEPRKIHTIVNTHSHFDHTGGNKKFRDWLKAEIAMHQSDKKALETGVGTLAEMFNEKPKSITVDKILRDGNTITTKNFRFRVLSTPGHTPGSICLYEENRGIMFSGDTLFADSLGRTDLPGGDNRKLHESLLKLSKHRINYLFPGHGMPKVGGVNFLIKQLLEFYRSSRIPRHVFIDKQV